jgi:hypothetical protein
MPRNITFWEDHRRELERDLAKVRTLLSRWHPSDRPSHDGIPPKMWKSHMSLWRLHNTYGRRLREKLAKLERRLAYYDERIKTLREKTVWDRILRGVL